MKAQSIDPPVYMGDDSDDQIISRALDILNSRVRIGPIFNSPAQVKDYMRLYFAEASAKGQEQFSVLFLDSQHRLIEARTLFYGTLNQTSVYPREVIKAALDVNAGAVVFAHNHPSGSSDPSRADEMLTQTLKSALALVDVRVLDHLVVGGNSVLSFAERGLL